MPSDLAVHGWLVLDKEKGASSARALARAKRILGARKAGHAGTLDPLATGVLPIAFGEATKTVRWAMEADKEYRFRIRWGVSTDTLDGEGSVVACSKRIPDRAAIEEVLPSFLGNIDQVPPRYSAIKVGGRPAYAYARQGEEVPLPTRSVTISELEALDLPDPRHADLRVRCGKGTYVRSLARDLARRLGTEAHVTALRRTRAGRFRGDDSISLAEWADLVDKGETEAHLLPADVVLADIPALELTDEQAAQVRQGRTVLLHGLPRDRDVVTRQGGRPVALGRWKNGRFAPRRVFCW